MQDPKDVLEMERVKSDGVSWIKRPTGGRAVLHFEDITYSCVFSKSLRFMGTSVQESYRIITRGLIEGLNKIGVICQAHDSYDQLHEVKREVKLPCFLAPNRDEIMVDGRKLVGSAQRRCTTGVLQHGSIPISDYYRKLPEYLNISDKEREIQRKLLQRKSVSLDELKIDVSVGTIIAALKAGFEESFGLKSVTQSWSNDEIAAIEKNISPENHSKIT
ncbi:MAG: hypothetical protein GX640_16265 [Fibrobacter sp.]|nr:hypothetical protein [Fibrobacter sp.]